MEKVQTKNQMVNEALFQQFINRKSIKITHKKKMEYIW